MSRKHPDRLRPPKAIEAILRWKFEPGSKEGIAVAVLVNVEVNFHLY